MFRKIWHPCRYGCCSFVVKVERGKPAVPADGLASHLLTSGGNAHANNEPWCSCFNQETLGWTYSQRSRNSIPVDGRHHKIGQSGSGRQGNDSLGISSEPDGYHWNHSPHVCGDSCDSTDVDTGSDPADWLSWWRGCDPTPCWRTI